MIRATFAAEPRRRSVLAAKAAVLGAVVLAVGLVTSLASCLMGSAILPGNGYTARERLSGAGIGGRLDARGHRHGGLPDADRPASLGIGAMPAQAIIPAPRLIAQPLSVVVCTGWPASIGAVGVAALAVAVWLIERRDA